MIRHRLIFFLVRLVRISLALYWHHRQRFNIKIIIGGFSMKECPECKAFNKDTNKYCSNCLKYLSNVESKSDAGYVDNLLKIQHKRHLKKRVIVASALLAFYLVFNCWSAMVCYDMFGNIDKYLQLIVWYLPCLPIFFFPYDKVYCFIRKKRNKPTKHIPDTFVVTYIAVGVLYLVIMYSQTYSIWEHYGDLITNSKL